MTIHESTELLDKAAAVKLLSDMLEQAEQDKRELLEALRGLLGEIGDHIGKRNVRKHYHLMVAEEAARAAIAKAERN